MSMKEWLKSKILAFSNFGLAIYAQIYVRIANGLLTSILKILSDLKINHTLGRSAQTIISPYKSASGFLDFCSFATKSGLRAWVLENTLVL